MARLQGFHRGWLLDLFRASFDERYYARLQRIGHVHVRIGLGAHFVYVGMNFLREQLRKVIETEVEPARQPSALQAVNKILDLNLDVMARTYHEEDLRRVFLSLKLDNALIRHTRRFTFGLNIFLVIGLIGLSLGMMVIIIRDVILMFRGEIALGLMDAMGSLLVLWLMIELLDAEIDRLKGGVFKIHLFVGVGLVALIREVLVLSLTHKDLILLGVFIGGVLVLGFIYWLLCRAETKK